jgi:hypothetical protein
MGTGRVHVEAELRVLLDAAREVRHADRDVIDAGEHLLSFENGFWRAPE